MNGKARSFQTARRFLLALLLVAFSTSLMAQSVYRIGTRKQLFGDGRWLAESHNVELVVHRPVLTHERCITADKPWESHRIGAYNTLIDTGKELRMYYDAIASDGSRWLCLATSTDGVHWDKPDLGVVPFKGNKHTNIVFPPEHRPFEPGAVFVDTKPGTPEDQRYKLVCTYRKKGEKKSATYAAVSRDGIRFRFLAEKPVFRNSDTGNVCFFDSTVGKYVGYVRIWDRWRKVGRIESDDFLHWGDVQEVLSYDAEDNRWLDPELFTAMDFYTNAVTRVPDADRVYVMFPSAYYHYTVETAKRLGRPYVRAKNDGPLDIQFAFSRDGVHWTRLDRRPFIQLGEAGEWDKGYAYMVTGLVNRGRETWLYYATASYTHGDYKASEDLYTGTITRAVLRRDGFVSVSAGEQPGDFITPPIVFEGSHLFVNVRTGAGGHVRVAVLDTSGAPHGGFDAGNCVPVNGNYIEKEITWRGRDVGVLAGTPVRLRFILRDADVFSFQFRK